MTVKRTNAISTMSLVVALGAVSIGCGEMEVDETVTSALASQAPAAFKNNLHHLQVATGPGVGSDSNFNMFVGTVPSQVRLPDGSWEIGFEREGTAHFMVDHYVPPSSHTVIDSNGVMAVNFIGTSPSLALCAGCSSWAFAFQGSNGHLVIGEGGNPLSGVDTGGVMRPGSSPSIAMFSDGTVALAIHGGADHLWVGLSGPMSGVDTHGLMWGSTSPSIAVGGASNSVAIAFHGSNGHLWVGDGPFTGMDRGCVMADDASPSAAVRGDGTTVVAFKSNTGKLGVWTAASGCVLRNQAIWAGSPIVFALPNPRLTQILFKQSPGQHLWIEVGGTDEDQLFFMD
jgi:hypothetical protein